MFPSEPLFFRDLLYSDLAEFGVPSPFEAVMSDVGRDHYDKGSSEFKGAG